MVEKIHDKQKNIIFLVSHNMNDIARMSDKVLVMNHGRLAMDGTVEEVFSRERELKEMGLALPDSMEMAGMLREAGLALTDSFLTMDMLADGVADAIKNKI